ncbi:MAG: hypothetical protein E7020_06415 [Alphaproteobacteria bacterium]|nr:hypothetical protein [Alphaproteobacteria bacterium]
MNNVTPNHFSNKLELSYKNRKSFLTDRAELKLLLPGIVFGFLLFLLGIYEWFNGLKTGGDLVIPAIETADYKPFLAVWFFDLCFVIVGLGIVITNILIYMRYNKYKFLGKKVVIIKRPIWRDKIILQEDLQNYTGVRFRVEFLQSGFLTHNRYVVELYHPNSEKIVPLYLSTSPNGVRKKWKEYARAFKLPALINTDDGLKSIDLKNLNKSVSQLVKMNIIKDTYDSYDSLPSSVDFVRKKDKMVLKVRKIVWDAYNLLAWLAILLIGSVVLLVLLNFDAFRQTYASTLYVMLIVALSIIFIAVQILFRKEKLVIKKHKIVNTHKYMLFSTKHNEIFKKDIEAIEVTENPATGRYFVSVISEDNTITFGAKMSIKDLQWIKRFLIHEIIK